MADAGKQDKRKSGRASGKAGGGGSIFDRLTDPSQYTGAHKHRFDADGKGKGLAGRDRVAKGRGSTGRGCSSKGPVVRNIGDILRTDEPAPAPAGRRHSQGEGKPKPKPKRASGAGAVGGAKPSAASPKRKSGRASGKAGGGGSIFDRLTDTSQYTGAHKHRFDADGKGKGLAGRDSVTKGGGAGRHRGSGAVADLSQITRSNLN